MMIFAPKLANYMFPFSTYQIYIFQIRIHIAPIRTDMNILHNPLAITNFANKDQ